MEQAAREEKKRRMEQVARDLAWEQKDQDRSMATITTEVLKILGNISLSNFLAKSVTERADWISYHRTHNSTCTHNWWFFVDKNDVQDGGKYVSVGGACTADCFVSARVNQILWEIKPTIRNSVKDTQPTMTNYIRRKKRQKVKIGYKQ